MAVAIFVRYALPVALIAQYALCQTSNQAQSLTNIKRDEESSQAESRIPRFTFDYEEIDEFIDAVMTCKDIFATGVAIVQLDEYDRVVDKYVQGYGIVDPVHPEFAKVTNKTQFCIGSITKQFTAAALGKHLVRHGKSFESRLISLLGEDGRFFGDRDFGALPTIRDLLSHRMGIPRYDTAWSIGPDESREAIWRRLHLLADDYDNAYVDKSYRSSSLYNNWMVALAGYVLQNITGRTWEEEINGTYFRPLEMSDASFTHESYGNPEKFALPAFRVRNETSDGDTFLRIDPEWFRYTTNFVAPDGSICMSSSDMLNYLTFLVSTNVSEELRPLKDSVDKTWAETSNLIRGSFFSDFAAPREAYVFESHEYGLCVEKGIYREYKIINHGGAVYGYNSFVLVFPELKLGVMISNTQGYNDPAYVLYLAYGLFDVVTKNLDNSFYTADKICRRYANATAQPNPASLAPYAECAKTSDVALQRLTGVYRHSVFGNLTIRFNETGFEDGFKFKFDWGVFAHATLCRMAESRSVDEYNLYFDPDGPLWVFNEEANRKLVNVRFVKDVGGRGVKVIVPVLQNTAPSVESVTFTNVNYNPCNPSSCLNGGKCVPVGDFDYRCHCPTPLTGTNCEIAPMHDCTDIRQYYPDTYKKSGVYRIEIPGMAKKSHNVYCDMDTDNGGWTVIQRRTDDKSEHQFDGNKTRYDDYVKGFGLPGQKYNYWMGLAAMQMLAGSAGKNYTLRINLTDCSGRSVWEEYQNFWLGNETTSFMLHVQPKSATGTAGDALTVSNSYISHNNMPFSAPGKEDNNDCVATYHSGWWFNNCFDCNLNGAYYDNCNSGGSNTDGIVWLPFHNGKYSMKFASMKIRRTSVTA